MDQKDEQLIKDIDNYLEHNKDKIVQEIQGLVQQKSIVNPRTISAKRPHGNHIHKAYIYLGKYLKSNDDVVAKYYQTKTNSLAYYDAYVPFDKSKQEKYLLFACHLDTVGFGNIEEWYLENPLSGAIHNGYIYGRGTVDDKGSIVMILWALRFLKHQNIKLPFNVRCFIGGDEEIGCATQEEYWHYNEHPALTIVPDGEFPFSYGEKCVNVFEIKIPSADTKITSIKATNIFNMVPGFCEITIDVPIEKIKRSFEEYLYENNLKGKLKRIKAGVTRIHLIGLSCHAISAHEGYNAITYMFNYLLTKSIIHNSIVIQYINNTLFNNLYGDIFGINAFDRVANTGSNINVGSVSLENNTFTFLLNIRFIPGLIDAKQIMNKINLYSTKFFGNAESFKIKQIIANDGFQHNLAKEPWKSIYVWLKEISGDNKTKPQLCSGGSYARLFPRAINMGPVLSTQKYQAHCTNEKIKISSVLTAIKYYIYILIKLGKNSKII